MIIVVEGISASGKTTYCRQFGEHVWLPEMPVKAERPPPDAPPEAHAAFWAAHNAARFRAAQEIEREHGYVVCDTDPLKLHYSWCMERAGFDWPDRFAMAQDAARREIAAGNLGFADLYLVKKIEPDAARAQKEADVTRRRGNFEQHLALQPHLLAWFEAMAKVLPGQVEFALPEPEALIARVQNKTPEDSPRRFDVSMFDALVAELPA